MSEEFKQLPDGWVVKNLGDVGKVITGKTPSKNTPEQWGDILDFITPSDYNGNKFLKNTPRKLSIDGKLKFKNLIIPKHSILVTCIGSDMGRIAINFNDCVTNQQINSIIVNTQKFSYDYIYYALQNKYSFIRNIALGGTTMPIVNKSTFEKIEIKTPPLEEQNEIAAVLSALDDKIEVNQQINKKLEEMAQAIFKQWFIDFNFPDENGNPYKDSGGAMIDSELGQIPAGWVVGTLGEKIKFLKGKKPSELFSFEINNKLLPYLTIDALNSGTLTYAETIRMVIANPLDILMVMDGASSGSVYFGKNGVVASTIAKLEVIQTNLIEIIYWLLRISQKEIKLQNTGAAIPHVDKNYISKILFALPNESSSYIDINSLLQTIRIKIIKNSIEIETLHKLRNLLLPKLITGKIRIGNEL